MYDNRVGGGRGQVPSQSSFGRGNAQPPGLGSMSGPPLSAGRAGNISNLGQQTIPGNYGARVPIGSAQAPSSYSGSPSLASRAIVAPPGAEPGPHVGPVGHQSISGGMSGNSGPRVPVGPNQGLSSAPSPLQPPPGYVKSPYDNYSSSRTSGW